MTALKPYPEYMDSGCDWLGAVPASWPIKRAKAILRERKVPSTSDDVHLTPSQIHGVLPQSEYMERTGNRVVLNLTGADSMRHVEPNDFISHLRSFQGGFEHSRLAGKVSAAYTVLEPREGVVPAFFRYLFKSSRYVQALQTTTDQLRDGQSIRFAQVVLVPLPLPSPEVQQGVADFLDRETAEIDAFIADQEELIGLLAERRAATISHAVTKGLDPKVPMKDSGVEWMGEVPEHWDAGNIRRFAHMRTGHTPSRSHDEYWIDCDIPWFTLADVWQLRKGQTYLGETKGLISEMGLANSAADLLPAGTVVLSRTASVGFTGIMPRPMATSQDYWNWICKASLDPKYLWFQFLAMRPHFASLVQGSTHKTIYQSDAAALGIAAPPIREQESIVEYLDQEIAEIDATIADAREAIALSRERRAALISAAVTGKIDVREHGAVA